MPAQKKEAVKITPFVAIPEAKVEESKSIEIIEETKVELTQAEPAMNKNKARRLKKQMDKMKQKQKEKEQEIEAQKAVAAANAAAAAAAHEKKKSV